MKGVLHWYPLSRERLMQSLSCLYSEKQGRDPTFVAVESSPAIWHGVLAEERPDFLRRAKADHHFDNLCPQKLALTLGHEVDSHSMIFAPTTPLVWLDQHRDEPGPKHGSAHGLGKRFYDYLRKFLNPTTIHDKTAFLHAVHEDQSVHDEQLDHVAANERDALWHVALSPYLVNEQPYSYAVAVVGREHLLHHRDTLRVLLQRQKIEVAVEDITE